MKIQTKQPAQLSQEEIDRWQQLVAQSKIFSSPYFHPQFTRDVATIRDDVEVAVISDADQIVGFFPFQRTGKTAKPVGGLLSDAHGVITEGSAELDFTQVLKECGLVAWRYHYQIASQIPDKKWHPERTSAAVMNLVGGFDDYKQRLSSGSVIKQTARKARKLERERGSLRFEWNSKDEHAFSQLLKWKSQQYADSGIADVFAFEWTEDLLRQVWSHDCDEFSGLMSVLYCDEKPAAVHFALRAGKVIHQWFPAYDPELAAYSPGVIHLLDEARHAAEIGVERIDLGRVCHYKSRVATDYVDVGEGCVDLRPVTRMLQHHYRRTFEWLRHSPLRNVAVIPGRMLRRLSERRQFE